MVDLIKPSIVPKLTRKPQSTLKAATIVPRVDRGNGICELERLI
jgi:hypothetical protein